ncbi:MAG: hypothetical protein F7B20_05660 [Aeropyrum sp.]|nr:hypothetical protein [Aeropyrum sp.]MCE4615689.1 hypothetical protein [Aeropyrum sp.]
MRRPGRNLLVEEARRSLDLLGELRMKSPRSIYTGDMEEALEEGSEIFRIVEEGGGGRSNWYAVKRPYSAYYVELELLGRMSAALRMRMIELNKLYVSGLDYFHRRLDRAIARGYSLLGSG